MNDVKYSICSSLDFEYRLWVIIFTQERASRQTFAYLKSTIETFEKSEDYLNLTIKTPERLSTLSIVNFVHNLLFFVVPCCWLWTSKCLLGPTLFINTEMTYGCNYWQIYKILSEIISKELQEKIVIQSRVVVLKKHFILVINRREQIFQSREFYESSYGQPFLNGYAIS